MTRRYGDDRGETAGEFWEEASIGVVVTGLRTLGSLPLLEGKPAAAGKKSLNVGL